MAVYDPAGGGNAHIDQVLTQVSLKYTNEPHIGEELVPSVAVSQQSDKYYEFGRENWQLDPVSSIRAPGTPAAEIGGRTLSLHTYFCVEHAYKTAVTEEEVQNSDTPLQPKADATEDLTDKHMLSQEIEVYTDLTTAANFNANNTVTLAGTDQWSDSVNSNPIADMKTGRDAIHASIFRRPNKTVIPYQVMSQIEDHPDLIERIKYSERGILNSTIMEALFQTGKVLIPGAGFNSANPGQADTFGYIWGKDVVMAFVNSKAKIKQLSTAYKFKWRYPSGQTRIVDGWYDKDRKSDIVRIQERWDMKRVAVDDAGLHIAGYLIKDAIA